MKTLFWVLAVSWIGLSGCADDLPAPPASSAKPEPTAHANDATPNPKTTSQRTVLATIEEMQEGIRSQQPQVVWYLLPTELREDVEELVHEFARRVDQNLWRNAIASWRDVQKILDQKADDILALPEFAFLTPEQKSSLRQQLRSEARLLSAILDSKLADLSHIQSLSLGEFLKTDGAAILATIRNTNASTESNEIGFMPMRTGAQPRVMEQDEQTARVGWFAESDRPVHEMLWVQHDGHWMPAAFLTGWEQVRLARRELQSTTEPLGVVEERLQSLEAADEVLKKLLATESAEEFAQVWQQKVSADVRVQLVSRYHATVGVGQPMTNADVTADQTTSNPDADPVPITNATQADYVTIEVRGKLDESAEDVLFLALEAAIAGDADVLQLPGQKHWTSQVGPVRDVDAFAKRLRIGRVLEVDAKNRRIVLEWTD